MDPSRVSALLFPPLSSAAAPSVDADILDYLASYDVDDEDEGGGDEAVQAVIDICASASPAFAALSEEEATARVFAFLTERASGQTSAAAAATSAAAAARNADSSDAAAAAAAAALAAALKDLGGGASSSSNPGGGRTDGLQRRPSRPAGSGGGEGEESGDEDDVGGESAAAVDALAGLVPPSACADRQEVRRFAGYALRERFGGDADAAADWLLSLCEGEGKEEDRSGCGGGVGGGAAGAVAEWRRLGKARKEAREREALARERDRQATLDRFAWRPDAAGGAKASGGGGKTRFLDGVPVTTRGEKYVVVSQKEEWDGGSRGRVKTKGKRGTGFA